MPPSRTAALRDALTQHLRLRPSSAGEACRQLGISQSRFSRLVAGMSSEVLRLGRARATRYVLRRAWPGLGSSLPLYEVDAAGAIRRAAVLHGAGERGIYVEPLVAEMEAGLHDGLPFFLHDVRPAGFLGRQVPRQHAHLAPAGLQTAQQRRLDASYPPGPRRPPVPGSAGAAGPSR